MKYYERGSAIVVEVEVELYTPFGSYAYVTPDTVKTLTITGPTGVVVVSAQVMTAIATGKLSYTFQSLVAHALGRYHGKVNVQHGSVTDILIKNDLFELI